MSWPRPSPRSTWWLPSVHRSWPRHRRSPHPAARRSPWAPSRPRPPPSPTSTSSTCPGRTRRPHGRISRWPRAATATAGSAPSPPSGASSARALPSRSWPKSTNWAGRTERWPKWCSWPRTSPRSPSTDRPVAPSPASTAPPWAATGPSSTWWPQCRRGCGGPGSSTSTPPPSMTRWSKPYWPLACLTSTSRSNTYRGPC